MSSYSYTAYGLNFESEIPIPELSASGTCDSDVSISIGKLPKTLKSSSDLGLAWSEEPGKLLLEVYGVGRYLVIGDNEVVIDPLDSADKQQLRMFFLGSVLGAILNLKGQLLIEASAILTNRGAVLIMGKPGVGKSTLLASFLKRGYPMLSDDKTAVTINGDKIPEVIPGFPFLKLPRVSARLLKYPVKKKQFDVDTGKFGIPVKEFCDENKEICAAYSLTAQNATEIGFERMRPMDRFQTLSQFVYRPKFVQSDEQRKSNFKEIALLGTVIDVAKASRPSNHKVIDELTDRIEEDFTR